MVSVPAASSAAKVWHPAYAQGHWNWTALPKKTRSFVYIFGVQKEGFLGKHLLADELWPLGLSQPGVSTRHWAQGAGHWVPGTGTGLVGAQEGRGAPCTTLGLLLN